MKIHEFTGFIYGEQIIYQLHLMMRLDSLLEVVEALFTGKLDSNFLIVLNLLTIVL